MNWIKIEDKLPEIGQRVIYYFENTGISIGKFVKEEKDIEYKNIFYAKQGFLTDDATHWMPLPDPPAPELLWICKYCGENETPKCHKCVREDGKPVEDELARG